MEKQSKSIKELKKTLLSKKALSVFLFFIAFLITIVYSLFSVSWDINRIDWGKFFWNMSIIVGLFLLTMFSGWMMEQQKILNDENSELSLARKDYQVSRDKIRPKDQYFGQYYLWEKARQITTLKADALTLIGWRSANGGDTATAILNATAQDIAENATEADIDKAIKVDENDAILVERNGKKFYISKISEKLGIETKKILVREEHIDFCSADYYLIGSSYDTKDNSPRFAKGKIISKKNTEKTVASISSSIILSVLWAMLLAGAVVDEFWGNGLDAYFNLVTRSMSLFCGLARGVGVASNYYDGIALMLRDKIEVLENFYNCVMVDGNFKPDTLTTTAESLFLKAREEERKRAEEHRKQEELKRLQEQEKEKEKETPEEEPKKEKKKSEPTIEKVSINDII